MSSTTPAIADHTEVRVGLLGPLTLAVAGVEVAVPGAKRRAVLAVLAMAEGAEVPVTDLIDTVWPDDPPEQARGAIQNHISRLRGHLGPAGDRLVGGPLGYRLHLRPGELDVDEARRGLATARDLARDDPASACVTLEAAQRLWRGRPLAEFGGLLALTPHTATLAELRRNLDSMLVRCALAAGDTDTAVRAASAARAADPDDETATLAYMEALIAAGRHAGALAAAAELRGRFRAEGLAPTQALLALERAAASGGTPFQHGTPSSGPGHTSGGENTGSIPLTATKLVGRESELAAVRRLLDDERLVTIVGTGGVGKTRVAAEVARRDEGEIHFVSLAPLTDPDDLTRALAASLGLESVRGDAFDACVRLLGAGPRLLVLDNCEHVIDRVRDVATALLSACPTLTLLATSRERLGLSAEAAFRLGPLALPDESSPDAERAPAMALFLDRARRARSGVALGGDDVAAAVAVVRQLEGVPLAIELAAGRLSSLTVADVRDRLGRALDLLDGGRTGTDARHRTLRATVQWSYDLLPEDRRRLVRHLAMFPDGVDLATAELLAAEVGVNGDPAAALAHLVDASMLEVELAATSRYRMLETVRTFGLEQLDANGERDAAERRLLHWAVMFTGWVDDALHTSDEATADRRLRTELANLRSAWTLAIRRGDLDTATAMIVALDDAAQWRDLPEVWEWARALADHSSLSSHPRAAAALATTSDFAWLQGDLARATQLADDALDRATDDDGRWRALLAMSVVRLSEGRFRESADLASRAAAITTRPEHARLIAALANAYAGDFDAAEAINAHQIASGGVTQQAEWEYTAGELASIAGRFDEAEHRYRRAIELASEVGSSFVVGIARVGLGTVLRATGRHGEALEVGRDALEYWLQAGNWIQAWTTLRNIATLLEELDEAETARAIVVAADHAPDAPALGESAWETARPAANEPTAVTVMGRDDVVRLALEAIDRHVHG